MALCKKTLKLLVLALILASFWNAPSVKASTNVSGVIPIDTTWTAANSPYIVSNLQVNTGATLNIDAGVVIKFQDSNSYIDVNGTLNANGTSANEVYFTSLTDDSVGGDTNGDSNTTTPQPQSWRNLKFNTGSTGSFNFSSISYAGGTPFTAIYNNGGNISISNSNISKNGESGILNFGGTLNISSSNISGQLFGVRLFNGTASIDTASIHDNSDFGIIAYNNGSSLTLTNNTFTNNGTAVSLLAGIDFIHSGNISSGPGVNGFEIGGAINTDKTWNLDTMPYVINTLSINSGATLNLDPGVIIKFEPGGYADIAGSLNATGTATNKIYFTSILDDTVGGDTNGDGPLSAPHIGDWRNLKFNSGTGNLSNVVLEYAGLPTFLGNVGIYNNGGTLTITDSLIKNNGDQGIFQSAGSTTITHSEISSQNDGIHRGGGTIDVTSSSIKNNSSLGIINDGSGTINAINNYWGDPTGPQNSISNPSGLGNAVSSNVNFIPFLTSDPLGTIVPPLAHNPVLIVPGVLGTDILKDDSKLWLDLGHNFTDLTDQFMDPLQFNSSLTPLDQNLQIGNLLKNPFVGEHYYDLIINEFKNQGYIEGSDLFTFPYDWRYGVNENTINQLRQKIQDIRTQTGTDKVDVIAHSTGGLLVKKYVIENLAENHLGKTIFVGVPNTGAPKAIKTLVRGDGFGIPWLSDEEMEKIAKNFPVVYDLSPSQQYFDTKGSYVKIINQGLLNSSSQDLDFNQSSYFLINDHGLNAQALNNAHALHSASFDNYDLRTAGVDLYAIDGCKTGTIGKITERRSTDIFGNNLIDYGQPEETPGDGTVPLESATNLPITLDHKYYALKAEHGKMPSQDGIRQEIVNIISGSNLNISSNLITQDISQCQLNGKAISIFSPLDINITDQDGNHSGLISGAIQNDIPNADFEIMGEHKFVYLPTDSGQHYTISLQGTGSGVFTLKSTDIVNNQSTQTETFSNIPVTTNLKGNLSIENSIVLSLDNNGDSLIDNTLTGIPGGTVTISSPLTITALNKTVTLGSAIPQLTANISGFLGTDTVANSATGSPACTTTATASSPVGTYPITCTIGTLTSNNYVFKTFVPGTLNITYRFDGFLQPINDTAHQVGQDLSVFKAGSTVPVKLQLKKVDGTVVQAAAVPVWLAPQKGSSMTAAVDESVYGDTGTSGTNFNFDTGAKQYTYNWSTKGLTAGYWYKIFVKLNDGNTYSMTVGLK